MGVTFDPAARRAVCDSRNPAAGLMLIDVRKYSPGDVDASVSVLANAFVTNPLHIAAFGSERLDQNRSFFRIGLRHMFVGRSFVAVVNRELRGYIHFKAWPYCLPAPEEIPRAAAPLLKPLGSALPRLITWLSRWSHLDPAEPHLHLGPIGVDPKAQGQGIGSALMNRYLEYLKAERVSGYLETDRSGNVEFYEKFGFNVQHEEVLLGVPVWTMRRPYQT